MVKPGARLARPGARCPGSRSRFLLKGDVFTEDLMDTYIAYKRENEVDAMRMRPHPYEFTLYYDA